MTLEVGEAEAAEVALVGAEVGVVGEGVVLELGEAQGPGHLRPVAAAPLAPDARRLAQRPSDQDLPHGSQMKRERWNRYRLSSAM